ncbi:MAG: hypothetical protein N838_27610 [Thiohalocapsa sp. PB-PSB1]|nr:MAG: hypothetical protein N838_27610 [Thiohalocapsa sp. PB-PSB1]
MKLAAVHMDQAIVSMLKLCVQMKNYCIAEIV